MLLNLPQDQRHDDSELENFVRRVLKRKSLDSIHCKVFTPKPFKSIY